jgi:hypothetical protein
MPPKLLLGGGEAHTAAASNKSTATITKRIHEKTTKKKLGELMHLMSK